MADAQNITWVRAPVNWEMNPGWAETIWSIEVMDPGLVCLPLVLRGLLWEFPNRQATQGGSFMSLLSLLGITPLLDSLRRDFKEQWFTLWCQNRTPLLSYPKRSLVYHNLAMYSLVISDTTSYFSKSSKLLGVWYGI